MAIGPLEERIMDMDRVQELIREKELLTLTLKKSLLALKAIYKTEQETKRILAESIPEVEKALLFLGEDTIVEMLKDETLKSNS